MIHKLSYLLAGYIGSQLTLENKKIPIVAYGLEVLMGGLFKLIIFTLISTLFGVFTQFLVAYLAGAALRLPSGGVHCSAYYRCLLTTLFIYTAISFIAVSFSSYPLPYDTILYITLFLTLFLFMKLSPVDVAEKPIRSPLRRKRLKLISCLVVLLFFPVHYFWQPENDILLVIIATALFQNFTLTAAGKKFFNFLDNYI
jgi:accessory gene regulator B